MFAARGPDGKQRLATRLLDQAQAILLPGSENGRDPFFSPDGQWIGFAAGAELKKIPVEGGASVKLVDGFSTGLSGASWGSDGNIVAVLGAFVPLSRIPAAGGPSQPFTRLGPGEITHRWPQVLPGGEDYSVNGASFVPGRSGLWSGKQLLYTGTGTLDLDLAPDGMRFVALVAPEIPAGGEKGTIHVTVLENFFDEVRRRIPLGEK